MKGRFVKTTVFAAFFAALQLVSCFAYAQSEAVTAQREENGITVNVNIPDADGYLTLMAVCPKKSVSDEYDTEIDDTGIIIGIETAEISDGEYSTVIPIGEEGPFGIYKIYVSYSGDKYEAECDYKRDTAGYKEELKNSLNADGADVMEVLKSYSDITLIDDDWISSLPNEIIEGFKSNVSEMLPVSDIEKFLDELNTNKTAASALNDINGAADAETMAAKLKGCAELFGLKFDPTETEASEFMRELFKSLPMYTDETLSRLNDSYILSRINESSWGAYDMLTKRYGYIGIDTANDMAGMSKTLSDEVFKKLALNAPFESINDFKTKYSAALKAVKDSGKGSKPSSGGGGSGGGGGRGTSSGTRVPVTAVTEISLGANNSAAITFNDLKDAEWSRESVEYLAARNVISGIGSGMFAPLDTVKREEFLKMLLNALDFTVVSGRSDFEDIEEGSWYENYVFTAYSGELVTGLSEVQFGIGENISRQDAAVMVKRALDKKKKTLDITLSEKAPADIAEVADYARDAVGAMFKANVLTGNEYGDFCPTNSLTRAEAAKIIYGILTTVR